MLNVKRDLIGKTITGLIAAPGRRLPEETAAGHQPCEIWMMQFSDGSYVEFVSPGARRGLRRSARSATDSPARNGKTNPQLALNVA